MREVLFESPVGVGVGSTGYTTVWTFSSVRGMSGVLNLEIVNTGIITLDDLKLQVQDTPGGEWYDYLAGADWQNSLLAYRLAATSNLPGLTGEEIGHAQVRIYAAHQVRLQGKSMATSTSVRVRGTYAEDD